MSPSAIRRAAIKRGHAILLAQRNGRLADEQRLRNSLEDFLRLHGVVADCEPVLAACSAENARSPAAIMGGLRTR